jgi:hypothetical protein
MGAVVFSGMLLVIGAMFLGVALDRHGVNSGVARWRAQFSGCGSARGGVRGSVRDEQDVGLARCGDGVPGGIGRRD